MPLTELKNNLAKVNYSINVNEELDIVFKNWRENYLNSLKKSIQTSNSVEEKQALGKQFNYLKKESETIFENKRWSLWYENREAKEVPNLKVNPSNKKICCKISKTIEQIAKFMNGIEGIKYYEEDSPIISVERNFDELLIGPDHPARANSDTYYLKNNKCLRCHNTPSTLSLLRMNEKKEFIGWSLGDVYRDDDMDSTHLKRFHQIDFVWVNKRALSKENLLNFIDQFVNYLFPDRAYKIVKSEFPFTNPSYEVEVACNCTINGKMKYGERYYCGLCKNSKYVEIIGCGFLKEEILKRTHPYHTAIALGLGVERICQLQNNIERVYQLIRERFK